MSEAFASTAFRAFADADPAFFGAWTGSLRMGAGAPVAVRVLLDQANAESGDFGELLVGQHSVTFLGLERGLAQPGAQVTANGVTYTLERNLADDGVSARWSAARV